MQANNINNSVVKKMKRTNIALAIGHALPIYAGEMWDIPDDILKPKVTVPEKEHFKGLQKRQDHLYKTKLKSMGR